MISLGKNLKQKFFSMYVKMMDILCTEILRNSRLDGIAFFFLQKVSHDDFFQRD